MRRTTHRRPVYKALHQPLSLGVAGLRIDRRFVLIAACAGVGALAIIGSFALGGVLALLILAAGVATRHDHQMLAILWRGQFVHARYDPSKHAPVQIVVTDDD